MGEKMTSKLCKNCGFIEKIHPVDYEVIVRAFREYRRCEKFIPAEDVCSVCEEHKCNSKICGCRCHLKQNYERLHFIKGEEFDDR